MGKIYESITELTGHTPLLHLARYEKAHSLEASIYAKLEFYNPNQSIKDRTAVSMIEAAEREGKIKPGDTLVEMTSGNTGIGVAAVAAAKGYKSRIFIQDDVSEERFASIRAFGGTTIKFMDDPFIKSVLGETDMDFVKTINRYEKEVLSKEKDLFFLNQDYNDANPNAHETTTGPEIWEDTDGQVDILVAGVGTGGTVSGLGRYLKKKNPDIQIVAVTPELDSMKTADHPEREEIIGLHPYDNVPVEEIQTSMDINVVDEKFEITTEPAKELVKEIALKEGIMVGTSSGGALYAATEIARREENKGKKIVVIFPDSGLRYLSTGLFDYEGVTGE